MRPVGPIATVAGHHGETLDRAAVADPEMEGWRRNEMRYLAGRVEELEGQLRRRTWLLGGGFGLCLLAATALAGAIWLPLPQPLNPWPIARQAATATTPPPITAPAQPVATPPPAVVERAPSAVTAPAANQPATPAAITPEAPPAPLLHPQSTERTTRGTDPNPLSDLAGQPLLETTPATTTEPAAGPAAVSVPSVSLPSVTVDPDTPAAPSTSGTKPPARASETINRLRAPDPTQ